MSDKVLDSTRPAATTDDEVVQHILSFLASSTWRSALESYLDEHCLVFSPAETNKLVYSDLHRDFCDMMDFLCEAALSEIGAKPDQLLAILRQAQQLSSDLAGGQGQVDSKSGLLLGAVDSILEKSTFSWFKKAMLERRERLLSEIKTLVGGSGQSNIVDQSQMAGEKSTQPRFKKGRWRKSVKTQQTLDESSLSAWAATGQRISGRVANVKVSRKFGFIEVQGLALQIFFHFSEVTRRRPSGKRKLAKGDAVSFAPQRATRKKKGYVATDVQWAERVLENKAATKSNAPRSNHLNQGSYAGILLGRTLAGVVTALLPPAAPTFGFISVPLLDKLVFFHRSNCYLKGTAPGAAAMGGKAREQKTELRVGLPVLFQLKRWDRANGPVGSGSKPAGATGPKGKVEAVSVRPQL